MGRIHAVGGIQRADFSGWNSTGRIQQLDLLTFALSRKTNIFLDVGNVALVTTHL